MDIEPILMRATEAIGRSYFQLPIDGREDPIYRERVYCYELYHQLRLYWPEDESYELSGEVDKSGHPLIRGNELDNVKPDLLVHTPGNMGGNFAVIEVKPINASRNGIAKDLATLTAFRRHARYRKAIYLIYGHGDMERILNTISELQFQDRENKIEIGLMEFWHHKEFGAPAIRVHRNA